MIEEIIVSVDIESDGDVPGINSLWSIGSAAFAIEKKEDIYVPRIISTFEVNLSDLPGAKSNPRNMEFWERFKGAWEYARQDQVSPVDAMKKYEAWLNGLGGKYVHAAWPATFDMPFISYYFHRFLGHSPFGTASLDMRSYAFCLLKRTSWEGGNLASLPAEWTPENTHPHFAIHDAIAQGHLACRMIIENLA